MAFLATLGALAALYVSEVAQRLPGKVVHEAGQTLLDVARAFRHENVQELFYGYATSIQGTSYLQVATLKETEVFERRDDASTFWGTLQLPEVAVRATAPVTYTYFVDLAGPWHFTLSDHQVQVEAPALRFNKPAIDASQIRYEVRRSSLLRDESSVLADLKRTLTGLSAIRAKQHLPLVREAARQQVGDFVRRWLLHSFRDARRYRVVVRFADEPVPSAASRPPQL